MTTTPYRPQRMRAVLTWHGGDLTEAPNLFPDKLADFRGYQMRVVTFHFPPRIFMKEGEKGSKPMLYGVDIEVVRALEKALNFSVEFHRPSDGEMWGWEQENGSWTGLMGDLQRRKADLGVADLYIMEQYFTIIDMSVEYDIEYLCFVNPVPGPLPQWIALSLPFPVETWAAIILTVAAGMILFAGVGKVGALVEQGVKHTTNDMEEIDTTNQPTESRRQNRALWDEQWFAAVSNSSLLLFGCVMNTSWCRVPRSQHLRLFIAVWSLSFVILAVAYRGSLVSHLTVPKEQPPLDTHRQLFASGKDVGSIGYTLKRVMEKNADPYVRRLAERYIHVSSTDQGLQWTVQDQFSFLESRGFLDYTIAVHYTDPKGRASLHVMREYIAPFGIGLAYPKFVPYIPKFNTVIRRLTEAGLAKKWMADIILDSKRAKLNAGRQGPGTLKPDTTFTTTNNVRPLTLDDLQGGYALLAMGYAFAGLTFVLERCRATVWTSIS
ncbi:ionotropic receptor 21a-like [Eriocheir sinensis]|uniref:ionotropic receptor 21a-like n=1 Tax=Eriocheir sinensis TaxID=95602 RepID=UPI0021CAC02C|nr:ionotropic receptor 21a-like [Eriocheir sinensis]